MGVLGRKIFRRAIHSFHEVQKRRLMEIIQLNWIREVACLFRRLCVLGKNNQLLETTLAVWLKSPLAVLIHEHKEI